MQKIHTDREPTTAAARERLLEQWVLQYGNMILRTCFVYLCDAAQAEDAMQDTFLKAWQSMERYDHKDALSEKAWLMRIAVNTCRDYRRSKWYRHIDHSKALDDLPVQSSASLPDDQTLLQDILLLPDKQKQVILLYYYHQLTLQEVSAILGISRSAVHLRLQKAQKTLKRILTRKEFS